MAVQSDVAAKPHSFTGLSISQWIPGMTFVKNTVIKPLMFATEKVIEQVYYREAAHIDQNEQNEV